MSKTYFLLGASLLISCAADLEPTDTNESELMCETCDTDPPPPEGGGSPGGGGGGGFGTVTETLVDRCEGDVIIARNYSDPLTFSITGLGLVRTPDGTTAWSETMPYTAGTYLRWYCNAPANRWIGPGTWRLGGGYAGNGCPPGFDAGPSACSFQQYIGSGSPPGWTAERSRCASPAANRIKARLGANRLLEIQCIM